tara:strand:+ start:95778 stop:96482 length:705 start_codon:yes stop_codon:yes gene_type:complete
MIRFLACVAFTLLVQLPVDAQDAATKRAAAKRPARAPNPAMVTIEDVPGLPRVLLIGDSISAGYTLPTRELLKGKANLHRIKANGGPTTRGLESIDKWLGDGHWDLIHFNWGIHDLRHMPNGERQVEPAEYESNLRTLVARLKQTGATLVFATTTPIPKGKLNPDRTFGDETEYNAIATRVMKENNVAINDLHGYIMPQFDKLHRPADLHYLPEGSDYLAKKVAAEIESRLTPR